MYKTLRDLQRKPQYLIGFFILVAILSAEFSQWGMTGIFFAVFLSGVGIGASVFVVKGIARKTNEMLDGKPNAMEHLLAPSGYRRKRYKESWKTYAKKSVVVPTPNRPLSRGDVVEAPSRAPRSERNTSSHTSKNVVKATTRAVVPARKAQKLELKNPQEWLHACLELAANFNPPHTEVVGRAIFGTGQRGSGKSNVAALLLEQLWKIPVLPGVVFDYRVDFASLEKLLPNVRIGGLATWEDADRYPKYWNVDSKNAAMIGYNVRETGAQLVIELASYPDMDTMAEVMTGVINGMFAWAKDHREHPLPAIVLLDEAQQFLPQSLNDSHISEKASKPLFRAFKNLNEIGRSYGLQPIIFTQRAARVNKDVIGGTEIWILMRQTMPQDLKACDDLLGQSVDRAKITHFNAGDAIVYEGGESFFVHFDQRQSKHLNRTPTLEDAMDHYQDSKVPEHFTVELPDEDDEYDPLDDEDEEIETEDLEEVQPAREPTAEERLSKEELLVFNAYQEGHKTGLAIAAVTTLPATKVNQSLNKLSHLGLVDWKPRGK